MLMPSIFGENLFDDLFDDFAYPVRSSARYNTSMNVMRTDIKEDENGYELHIELPGYQKEDVKAQLKDGYLTISANTDQGKEEKDDNGKFIRKERYYGSSSRSFYVGENITEEDIKAKFENGILKVSVPKKEKVPAVEENKYISIEG